MKRLLIFAIVALCAAAAAWAAKPAILKLKVDDLIAVFTFETGQKATVTSKGTSMAPGTYNVKAVSIFKKDDKGRVWELRTVDKGKQRDEEKLIAKPKLGSLEVMALDEEQEKVIDPGPPLALKGAGRTSDKTHDVHISFTAHGRYSEVYHPGAFLDGKKPPAPTYKILDENGKVLASGTFDVSREGAFTADWKQGAWKGKYTVTVEAAFGPFEYKLTPTEKVFEVK